MHSSWCRSGLCSNMQCKAVGSQENGEGCKEDKHCKLGKCSTKYVDGDISKDMRYCGLKHGDSCSADSQCGWNDCIKGRCGLPVSIVPKFYLIA